MLKKLQIKFICINMLIVAVMLCIIFGLVYHFTAESLGNEAVQMLQTLADTRYKPEKPEGEDFYELDGGKGPPPDLREDDKYDKQHPPEKHDHLDDLHTGIRLPHFMIEIDEQGALSATGTGYFDLSNEEMLSELIDEVYRCGTEDGLLSEYQVHFLRTSGPAGERIIFVDSSGSIITMRNLVRYGTAISILSLLLFFALSIFFARWTVKPVAKAWDQQKQFVADASHELKTPLTVIMTSAELLQDPGQNQAERDRSTGRILTMSRQMRDLVESLLDLARADNGAARMSFSEENVSQIIETAVLTFEPLFYEKGMKLEHTIQEGITLSCSAAHITDLAEILLDNALKYAAPSGVVHVTFRSHGCHVQLSVASPGQTISPADLKNIFKRFYRLDQSRSRDGSYGLGLSIAESIVTAHRGRIWAESKDGINTFHVQLPIK